MEVWLGELRRDYGGGRVLLDEGSMRDDPFEVFAEWIETAREKCANEIEVNAMNLSTVTADNKPSGRIVLLKHFDPRGLCFYTNYESDKGRQMAHTPYAAATFYWGSLERQIRVEGRIEKTTDDEADRYFATRPVKSRISTWVQPSQSQVVENRQQLETAFDQATQKWAGNEDVKRPPYWGGYRLVPDRFEFWQGAPSRLHDRVVYTKREGNQWNKMRLSP